MRILAAARDVFAANGLGGARVDAIAAAAGVTKQLVYQYYESKENLFAAVLADASGAVMSELMALETAQLAPPDALRAFLNRMFDQYDNDPVAHPVAGGVALPRVA